MALLRCIKPIRVPAPVWLHELYLVTYGWGEHSRCWDRAFHPVPPHRLCNPTLSKEQFPLTVTVSEERSVPSLWNIVHVLLGPIPVVGGASHDAGVSRFEGWTFFLQEYAAGQEIQRHFRSPVLYVQPLIFNVTGITRRFSYVNKLQNNYIYFTYSEKS